MESPEMTKTIRVSQQGLTQCPQCNHHIRTESRIEETTCPFCGEALLQAPVNRRVRGRGAKMALALFGTAAILSACGGVAVPAYGVAPSETVNEAPASDAGTGPDQIIVEQAPDSPGGIPKYGAPPNP